VRALLDPYDALVGRDDGGVAFTRVATTLMARREWRYDAYVGVARHHEERGEVSAAWLELPTQGDDLRADCRIDYRSARYYPDDTARIPRGVFPVSAPSALEYNGTRTLALGPLDPAFFRWATGRSLEEDEGAQSSTYSGRAVPLQVVALDDWLARASYGTELRLLPDVARALGFDLVVSLSATSDATGPGGDRFVVEVAAPAAGRAVYGAPLDQGRLPDERDRRDTLPESLRVAFDLRADEPIWREWRSD
jgi:hypothetical protein